MRPDPTEAKSPEGVGDRAHITRPSPSIHRYVLYCDEAYTAAKGLRYHHFYGGALVDEHLIPHVEAALAAAAGASRHGREMKWQKMDEMMLPAFLAFMGAFFDLMAKGHIRARVMCLDKRFQPTLTGEQKETSFQRLYYTFIATAFGWSHATLGHGDSVVLRIFLHQLPDKHESNAAMKAFLRGIPRRTASHLRMSVPADGISEVAGKSHMILQSIDTLIGSLGFRLNGFHKVLQPGGRRGKRTRAKEKLQKYIGERLRDLGVKNIGITTGRPAGAVSLWSDPVRIWHLQPRDCRLDREWLARHQAHKNSPASPT